jgi:hypothetical protein
VAVFEVQSAAGVPDVIAAVFDREVIAASTDTGFVTDAASMAALQALSGGAAADQPDGRGDEQH